MSAIHNPDEVGGADAVISRVAYHVLSPLFWMLHVAGVCARLFSRNGFEEVRWRAGEIGAWVQYQSALRCVPAYRRFVEQHDAQGASAVLSIAGAPAIDKTSYVRAYPLPERCVGGRLPERGIMIDESSGSGGLPTNWVRGPAERAANCRAVRLSLRRGFGRESVFFINAYALGPWAAGVNATVSLTSLTRVKTVGADVARVESTLKQFGTAHHYVLLGYPPFLKQVVDRADIDFTQYRVSMLYGGEDMNESTRRYLQSKGIKWVAGTYGASDLDVNLAAESKFTIALRRLLELRPELAAKVVRHAGALPMIFQFNPSEFFFETNAEGELLVTICRPRYVAPKIRYNIHDVGHVMRMPELRRLLEEAGVALADLDGTARDLPLLFHYGRSDSTVTFYGCKISPADVQEAVSRRPALAAVVDAFQLHTYSDGDGDKRLVVSLEVTEGGRAQSPAHWARLLFDALAEVKEHLREVQKMYPAGKEPTVELHAPGTGPFAGATARIKRNYVRRMNTE